MRVRAAVGLGTVHMVLPDGVDDPARPSGGNNYDRRIRIGLSALGWTVVECAAPGTWPSPDGSALAGLADVLTAIPDDDVVLVDGLIASAAPDVLLPQARRLRLVVVMHMPLGVTGPDHPVGHPEDAYRKEHAVLSVADAVVATSRWTRDRLLDQYALHPGRVHVAEPGVDRADPAPGATAGELLCVAAVAPHKGHDVLFAALAGVADLPWRCVCVGSLDRDPEFVDRIRGRARSAGIDDRISLVGVRTGPDLDAAYAAADVLVLASHAETYGMVVTEALVRGMPVIATAVGGLPEAVGTGADGTVPGLLVPAADPAAFSTALRRWLGDAGLRRRLRRTAAERGKQLPEWSETARRISAVLTEVAG